MIALIQRVTRAEVTVGETSAGRIDNGMLALIGIVKGDTLRNAERLVERLLGYRIFQDEKGRMNLSVRDVGGGLLLVPQFTLAADTRKGTRPGFSTAAAPGMAESLFRQLVDIARAAHNPVATGVFGAEMSVALVNHGPVTFWLDA